MAIGLFSNGCGSVLSFDVVAVCLSSSTMTKEEETIMTIMTMTKKCNNVPQEAIVLQNEKERERESVCVCVCVDRRA